MSDIVEQIPDIDAQEYVEWCNELVKEKIGDLADRHLLTWLHNIYYFEAPAAMHHHGAEKSGLLRHSLQVASELRNLTDRLDLKWIRPQSPEIVGLLHDICKTDDYAWDNTVQDISWNDTQFMEGHGDKSVLMIAGHFDLTEEEVACIQYHMGAFTDKEQWKYYSAAVKRWPNVLYTHTADMIASQIVGV